MKIASLLGFGVLAVCIGSNLSRTGVAGLAVEMKDPVMQALVVFICVMLVWLMVSYIRLVIAGQRLNRINLRRVQAEWRLIEEEKRRRTAARTSGGQRSRAASEVSPGHTVCKSRSAR
jgi:hypothetical protein